MITILYYPCNFSLTICLPIVKQLIITHTLPLLGVGAYLGLKIKDEGKDKAHAKLTSILHTINPLSSS